jgi:hypothetical protein
MQCPRCGTAYPHPTAPGEPRLRCHSCGARLFAWLGDHFGIHDATTATARRERRADGVEWWMVLLLVFVLIVVLSCICLSGSLR